MDQKLLSFCFSGRNDNYCGNFKYRLKTVLNYLAWSAQQTGLLEQIEVLVTDWNSEIPLIESIELTPEANFISSFLYVSPVVADKYHPDKNQVFNLPCATNSSIRRASGQFICLMPADILFPPPPLLNLIKILNGEIAIPYDVSNCLLKISRKILPWQLVEMELDLKELESYLININGKISDYGASRPDLSAGLGGILASKKIWHLSRGSDERYTGYGFSDVEFGLRIEQVYPGLELSHYGIYVYDLEQNPKYIGEAKSKIMNTCVYTDKMQVNSDRWGLGGEKLCIQKVSRLMSPKQPLSDNNGLKQENFQFKNRRELINHMANEKYYYFLSKHLPFSKNFTMKTKFLFPLTWYGLTFTPTKYLEFGVSSFVGAPIAALVNKWIDISIVSRWEGKSNQKYQMSPWDIASLLSEVDYMGRCKYIGGDETTALSRLSAAYGENISFDIVLFQPDLFQERAPLFLLDIMKYLSNNGAIVIAGGSEEAFRICWKEAKKKYPSYTYVQCFLNEVGIILKFNTGDNGLTLNDADEQKILKKAWRPVKANKSVYYLALVMNFLSRIFQKMYHQPLWLLPMLALRYLRRRLKKQLQ